MGMTACFKTISAEDLAKLQSDPDLTDNFADEICDGVPEGHFCDLDKSWQTIHYLISGDVWEGASPQSQVVLGGVEIGDDLGYGPARYHDVEQVQRLADSIRHLDSAALERRFDPQAMERAELYAFSSEHAEEELEMAQDYFAELKKLYLGAAQRGEAILTFMI